MPRIGFHVSAWGSDHVLAALSGVSRNDFHGLEIFADTTHIFADRPEEFRTILDITKVALAGVHGGGSLTHPENHDAEEAEGTRLLDGTRAVPGDYAIYYGGDPTADAAADLENGAALLNRLGRAARDRGVTFCYEPDGSCPFRSREAIAALMSRTDPALVGLSADTAHLTGMNVDPSLFLLTQKSRVKVVHMRDLRVDGSTLHGRYADPGAGTIDLVGVADTLRAIGFDGWIVGVVSQPGVSAMHSVDATAKFFRDRLALEF